MSPELSTPTPPPPQNQSMDQLIKDKVNVKVRFQEETEEEKLKRRKEERKKRQLLKQLKRAGNLQEGKNLGGSKGPWLNKFGKIFDEETQFVTRVQLALPEVRNPYLYEEEGGSQFLLEAEDKKKKERFEEGLKSKSKDRALTHEELKDRLHKKMAELSKPPNERKRLRKQKLKEEKRLEKDQKKKKFISKSNPNLTNQQKGEGLGEEKPKTPLVRNKPVVKSNGEIVYSKFDFISSDKRSSDGSIKKTKPSAEDMLKRVQKTENVLTKLENRGKAAQAEVLVQTQKWESALKRAQGEKIRDDANLLKKTIKKQEKKKQVSKKKWQERTERVEKQKEAKQEKRKSNIQKRKDEKIKKVKKGLRKKGRLA